VKKVPYLFFSHATHKDYHGPGDTAALVDYARLAQDTTVIAQIVEDVARLQKPPQYLQQPVYPPTETSALKREMDLVLKERKDLSAGYRLVFEDFKARLDRDDSREARRVATSALLALATPRLSPFMLRFILGPYYEKEGMREIAAGVYEEALKWTTDNSTRQELEEKIKSLRGL
jgi:hypothetical protein